MKIKTEIEIVTGFLGSGKTSFINALLKNTLVKGESVLILQYEEGEKNIRSESYPEARVIINKQGSSRPLSSTYVKQMINFYNPHRIIVEYNGMKMIGEILNLFNEDLEELCLEPIVYHVIDALMFEMFITNMKELIEPFLSHSNLIVVNHSSLLQSKGEKMLIKKIETLNGKAFIIPVANISELESSLRKSDAFEDKIVKSFRIFLRNKITKRLI